MGKVYLSILPSVYFISQTTEQILIKFGTGESTLKVVRKI